MTNFEKYKEGGSCSEIPNNSDCVSRWAVFDALEGEIIHCEECKHMMPDGRCREFADRSIYPSAGDFCSVAERKTDEIMIMFDEDGTAREYRDDFDITIHCESKEEQEEVWKRLAQDDWTPCSKELPTEDGDYLVTLEEGYADDHGLELIIIMNFEADCESFGYWYESFDPHTLGSLGADWMVVPVTAWKPLPEPWEGEKDETD